MNGRRLIAQLGNIQWQSDGYKMLLPEGKTYYWSVQAIDGALSGGPWSEIMKADIPDKAGIITGIATVCQGQTDVRYAVPEIINATAYVWTLPVGAVLTSDSDTNCITVNYSNDAVSGNISVHGKNAIGYGNESSAFFVTVNPIYTHTENVTICQGESYKGHSTSGTFIENFQTILGCDSIITYNLIVSNDDSCINTVENIPDNIAIISPNPTTGKLYIHLNESYSCDVRIEIINSLGNIIGVTPSYLSNNNILIDLSGNPKGMYLITLTMKKGFYYQKILKE
jgi:hypothetical protein